MSTEPQSITITVAGGRTLSGHYWIVQIADARWLHVEFNDVERSHRIHAETLDPESNVEHQARHVLAWIAGAKQPARYVVCDAAVHRCADDGQPACGSLDSITQVVDELASAYPGLCRACFP